MNLHPNRRGILCAFAAALALPVGARAAPLLALPRFDPVGRGQLKVLFVPVLDLVLYAPDAKWRPDAPYALQTTFLRPLQRDRMVMHALNEMRHIGHADDPRLAAWGQKLSGILPDVKTGDVLTLVRSPEGATAFFLGEARLGRVADPAFTDAVFGICLSPRTSQPQLRRQVLGPYAA